MEYKADKNRYEKMTYRRCGNSGLMLPEISLGLWHNFGGVDDPENFKKILFTAFDSGITHFDLANNYGPPAGSAEENFGKIMNSDLKKYRDELIISTKAGYRMWPGPYGEWGSRKYLISSLDQSLKRMQLDYVDIFYSHRFDPDTDIEETALALDSIAKQGKALYIGVSSYEAEDTQRIINIFNELKTPFIIHQPSYSMLNRWIENKLVKVLEENNKGCIAFSPLAQGILTDKYLHGIPEDSRAHKSSGFLQESDVTADKIAKVKKLQEIAKGRNQTIAQMAIAWILRLNVVTSVLVGASRVEQLKDNINSLNNKNFTEEELLKIDKILNEYRN